MIQNMGRSAAAAMFQRNQIIRNQNEWLDYVESRDGGAIGPEISEYLPGQRRQRGRSNPYLKYYAQMQRDAMEYRRRVALQQMAMQRQMAVQQHEFMLRQQHEENQIQRSEEERKRKDLQLREQLDSVRNDDRFSTAQREHYEKFLQDELQGLGGAPKLFTYTKEESGYFYPDNYPVKEKRGKPMLNTIQLDNETGQKTITGVPAKELYQDYQAQFNNDRAADLEQEKENRAKAEAFAKALTPSPAERKEAEAKRIAELPFRKKQIGDNTTSRPLHEAAQKAWHDDAREQAKQLYVDQMKQGQDYDNAVRANKKDLQSQLEAQYNADFEQNSGDETHKAGQFLKQKTDELWNERHTASPQDTREMFAAQDPGMGQDLFDDPGMDFDPVDETYTLDEIA